MFDREYERYESFMMYASYGKNPQDIHFFDQEDNPRRQSFLDAIDEDEEAIDDDPWEEDDWDDYEEDDDEGWYDEYEDDGDRYTGPY